MKSLQDIQNKEVRAEIERLSEIFEGSFINDNMEFIAVLKFRNKFANEYFIIYNCESALDVKCKVLEWFSRACFKTSIGRSRKIDDEFHKYMRDCVNEYFGIEFGLWGEREFEDIYTYLGNSINRKKTIKFIESNFDFSVLEG